MARRRMEVWRTVAPLGGVALIRSSLDGVHTSGAAARRMSLPWRHELRDEQPCVRHEDVMIFNTH